MKTHNEFMEEVKEAMSIRARTEDAIQKEKVINSRQQNIRKNDLGETTCNPNGQGHISADTLSESSEVKKDIRMEIGEIVTKEMIEDVARVERNKHDANQKETAEVKDDK